MAGSILDQIQISNIDILVIGTDTGNLYARFDLLTISIRKPWLGALPSTRWLVTVES